MIKILNSYQSYLANEVGHTEETIVKYLGNLHILFNKMQVTDVTQLKDIAYNKRLLDSFWIKKSMAESTRATYISSLKSFIKFCYEQKHIPADYSIVLKVPKQPLKMKEGLTSDEQKKLRQYIATPQNLRTEKQMRDAALMMFLWATGCRISEALRLNCHPHSYIYFDNDTGRSGDFHVDDGKVYVYIQGKNKRDRKIIVSDDALLYLNLYLHERKNKNEILFQNTINNRSSSKRLTRSGAMAAIEQVFKIVGIKKEAGLSTHVFRHTAINHWISKNYPDHKIITMTGHATAEGLRDYHLRNKKHTDEFGTTKEGKTTGVLDNKKLKQFEDLIRKRHTNI